MMETVIKREVEKRRTESIEHFEARIRDLEGKVLFTPVSRYTLMEANAEMDQIISCNTSRSWVRVSPRLGLHCGVGDGALTRAHE